MQLEKFLTLILKNLILDLTTYHKHKKEGYSLITKCTEKGIRIYYASFFIRENIAGKVINSTAITNNAVVKGRSQTKLIPS